MGSTGSKHSCMQSACLTSLGLQCILFAFSTHCLAHHAKSDSPYIVLTSEQEMWGLVAGHEADARVLQQQLSSLVTEQQAAQQYMTDNPPPDMAVHQGQHQHQNRDAAAKQGAVGAVDWKWDILRPVNLPASFS